MNKITKITPMERKSLRSESNQSNSKTPPRVRHNSDLDREDEVEGNLQKMNISSIGRFRKSNSRASSDLNFNEINSSNVNSGCDKCEKCLLFKENLMKAVNYMRSYIDNINDKLNLAYHKTGQLKKNSNNDIENTLSPEYYHAIYYSEMDKLKLGSDMMNQFRFLMKSLRLFNDKYDYIVKKHENFEKMAQEYKNIKLSNKIEEMSQLSEAEVNEVKSLSEHSIFKNFNNARDNFENSLKDLKNMLNGNNDRSTNIGMESFEIPSENKFSEGSNKETYIRNELTRMSKENTSLRLELNYIYERLREDNKIYEIKEDIIIKKSNSNVSANYKDNVNSNATDSKLFKQKSKMNYNSGSSTVNTNNFPSSLVVFKVKNEKKDEDYWIAKNYIKMLRQSEFYMI